MDRRGVSPVIAVLLLIVITVAAAVLVYIWLIGFMQSQTTTTGATVLGEKLKFEAVKLSATTDKFSAYVRNIGDTSVTITDAYLLTADGQTSLGRDDDFTSVTINVNEVKEITVDFSDECDIQANTVYVVKLVTNLGTEFTIRVKAS